MSNHEGAFFFTRAIEGIRGEDTAMNQELPAEENASGFRPTLREVFSFPHPVNEVAARLVAGMVAALSLGIIIFEAYWLLPVLPGQSSDRANPEPHGPAVYQGAGPRP